MKILLADDDSDLVDLTTYALLRQGHRVLSAFDGAQALQRCVAEQPDLVLLDVTLPQMTGLEICRRIRQTSSVPIIMLSGHREEEDLIRAYESGADDYIVKPFSMRHLLLRIDTLMRRVAGTQSEWNGRGGSRVDIGDLIIDRVAFEVRKNGCRITFTPLEFRILYYLAYHAGKLVETQRLADYAWQSPAAGDAGLLKTHVSHIRQKLTDAGGDPLQIRAVPRTGYILSSEPDAGVALPKHLPALMTDSLH